jgi:hypothetical protein
MSTSAHPKWLESQGDAQAPERPEQDAPVLPPPPRNRLFVSAALRAGLGQRPPAIGRFSWE